MWNDLKGKYKKGMGNRGGYDRFHIRSYIKKISKRQESYH